MLQNKNTWIEAKDGEGRWRLRPVKGSGDAYKIKRNINITFNIYIYIYKTKRENRENDIFTSGTVERSGGERKKKRRTVERGSRQRGSRERDRETEKQRDKERNKNEMGKKVLSMGLTSIHIYDDTVVVNKSSQIISKQRRLIYLKNVNIGIFHDGYLWRHCRHNYFLAFLGNRLIYKQNLLRI